MKKRIIICFLVFASVLIIASCGNKTTTQEFEQSNTLQESKSGFETFEKILTENGISYEKTFMAADMIGAVEGYAYIIGENKVELYRFDSASTAYKNAVSTGKVVLEGFNIECDILLNGEYGIINATPETIEIFNNL